MRQFSASDDLAGSLLTYKWLKIQFELGFMSDELAVHAPTEEAEVGTELADHLLSRKCKEVQYSGC